MGECRRAREKELGRKEQRAGRSWSQREMGPSGKSRSFCFLWQAMQRAGRPLSQLFLLRPWRLHGLRAPRSWDVRASSWASPLPMRPQERTLQDLHRTRHSLLCSCCLFHSADKPGNATLHFGLQLFYRRIVVNCPVGQIGLFGHWHLRRQTCLRLLARISARSHHAVDLSIFRGGDADDYIIIGFKMRFEK